MMVKNVALWVFILIGISANLMFQDSLSADAEAIWERKRLHEPSPALQERERAGQVTIFDGVTVTEVDTAVDEQFDRIGSMMLVGTKRPADDGATRLAPIAPYSDSSESHRSAENPISHPF